MRFLCILAVLFFGISAQAYSAATLVVTSSKKEGEHTRISYTVNGWTTQDKTMTACGPTNLKCMLVPVIKTGTSNVSHFEVASFFSSKGSYMTLGEVLSEFTSLGLIRMPYSGSFLSSISVSNGDCLQWRLYVTGSATTNVTDCHSTLPPPVQCSLYGNTTIDHKTLSDNALNGAQASTSLNLNCQGSANVIIKATRTNSYGVRLKSDDSLYSEVKINDKDATNGINIPITSNLNYPLNITSTLKTRGTVTPGPFSGSTIITVSPL